MRKVLSYYNIKISAHRVFRQQKTQIILGFVILFIVTSLTAWLSNLNSIFNSDYLIDPYLFQNFHLHSVIVPLQHSNLLKYPLFALQAIIPYNILTISIVNIGLMLITILTWYLLSLFITKGKHALLIASSFSVILIGSMLFTHEIVGPTIRNIEYPIAFGFIIGLNFILKGKVRNNLQRLAVGLVTCLYALTIAGDAFFIYTVSASILLVLIGYMILTRNHINRPYVVALILVIMTAVGGLVIRRLTSMIGVVDLYNDPTFSLKVLPIEHLGPSIGVASQQVLELFGANIFGKVPGRALALSLVNLVILVVSLLGSGAIIVDTVKIYLKKSIDFKNYFVIVSLAISSLIVFVVYILSDLVVRSDASGNLVSANQDRYLTLIVFCSTISLPYLFSRVKNHRLTLTFNLLLVLTLLVCIPSSIKSYQQQYLTSGKPFAQTLDNIAKELKQNNVNLVISGYWYAAPTKLFSGNTISFATVNSCNLLSPKFNINARWYLPSNQKINSALLVDRSGPDKSYWNCTDAQIFHIYGKPIKTIPVENGVKLFIYNYDTRTKVQRF